MCIVEWKKFKYMSCEAWVVIMKVCPSFVSLIAVTTNICLIPDHFEAAVDLFTNTTKNWTVQMSQLNLKE